MAKYTLGAPYFLDGIRGLAITFHALLSRLGGRGG
jgi:hypothetical protein